MHWQYTPYVWIFLTGTLLTGGMGVYSWRHRSIPGAAPFALLQFASAWWSLSYALERSRSDLPGMILFANLAYIGIVLEAPAALGLAMRYSGRHGWPSRRVAAWLSVMPVVTLALTWTTHIHGLVRRNMVVKAAGSTVYMARGQGPWFWIHFIYSYGLIFAALWILFQAVRRSPRSHRGQPVVLIAGMIIICLGNLLYNLARARFSFSLDFTSIMFVPAGLVSMLGLFRYRLFDIAPIARATIFENMHDSVIVLDAQNRIADINSAACRLLGFPAGKARGLPAQVLFGRQHQSTLIARYRNVNEARDEIEVPYEGQRIYFDLRISPINDLRGQRIGRLVVLHDITKRKRVEEELRQAKLAAEAASRAK